MEKLFKNSFAKIRTIIAHGIVCTLLLAVISCDNSKPYEIDNDEDNVEQCTEPLTNLKGTRWRLVGIVNTRTGAIEILEPRYCAICYTLTFETDRIIFARGIKYTLKLDLDNPIGLPFGIDDFRFHSALRSNSLSATYSELRLYHCFSYALFKRIDMDEGWGDNEQNLLRETAWQVVGIVDIETNTLRELDPGPFWWSHCEDCFTLVFINHRSFTARSAALLFFGNYRVNYATHGIAIDAVPSVSSMVSHDERLFSFALSFAQSFAITTDDKLRLYSLMPEHYPYAEIINNSYLLFRRVDL